MFSGIKATGADHGRHVVLGDWRFEPDRNMLWQGETAHRLENKQARVLLYLLAHAGEVVGKDALLSFVWDQKFVGDDVLTVAVSHLRKTLGDNARQPLYIKTEPKQGYRFIAPLDPAQRARAQHLLFPEASEQSQLEATPAPQRVVLLMAGLVLGVILFWAVLSPSFTDPAPTESNLMSEAQAKLSGQTVEEWRDAYRLFSKAVQTDSGLADAYSGMVRAQLKILSGRGDLLYEARAEMRDLLLKAAASAPDKAEVPYLLATIYFHIFWDFDAAETQFQRALSLRGDAPQFWSGYAQFRLALGDFSGALDALDKARALDPLLHGSVQAVWLLNMQRRYDDAQLALEKLLQVQPDTLLYHVSAQALHENRGDDLRSFEHLARVLALAGFPEQDRDRADRLFRQGGLAAVYGWLAESGTARRDIGQYDAPLSLARYAIKAGDHGAALDHLDAALAARQRELLWIGVDPKYDPLRADPRFQALLRAIGLPQARPQQAS